LKLYYVKEETLIKILKKEMPDLDFDNLPEARQQAIIDNATRLVLDAANSQVSKE